MQAKDLDISRLQWQLTEPMCASVKRYSAVVVRTFQLFDLARKSSSAKKIFFDDVQTAVSCSKLLMNAKIGFRANTVSFI